jgi:hypothetical protein
MESVTNANFGPLIAYLVPGATVLGGLSPFSATLRTWFGAGPANAPTIGGFLYLTVASIAVGMTVSAVRWAFVDTLHGYTGLPLPRLDFSRLGKNVAAYGLLIEIHYRHYQFYANELVATAIAYACYRTKLGGLWPLGWPDLVFPVLEAIFFLTSRDCVRKYYTRSQQLLAADTQSDLCEPIRQRRQAIAVTMTSDPGTHRLPREKSTEYDDCSDGPISAQRQDRPYDRTRHASHDCLGVPPKSQ